MSTILIDNLGLKAVDVRNTRWMILISMPELVHDRRVEDVEIVLRVCVS